MFNEQAQETRFSMATTSSAPSASTRRSLRNMNRGDVIVALLLSLVISGCMGGLVQPPPPAGPVAATPVADEIRTLVELVNKHRRSVGCKDLIWVDSIAEVAQKHSDDMVRRGYFNHVNPDGETPFKRLEKAGIRYMRAAENIAAGQQTAVIVMTSWLNSPGHRRNIEDCTMREHGIGLTRGTKVLPYGVITNAWTHNFTQLRP